VGKSSLINRLAGRRRLAPISRAPGKTRALDFYLVDDRFFLVDLPGYGYAKVSKSRRRFFAGLVEPYLTSRRELAGIIQLIDARHGPVAGDHDMLGWLGEWSGGKVLYVFTKADKLSGNERARLRKSFEREFGAESVVLSSAVTGMGIDDIRRWMDAAVSQHKRTGKMR